MPTPPEGEQPTLPPRADLASDVTLPPAPRRDAAAPGEVVPGYEVLAELGRGGMGVVFKARQVGLNRLVALKMILAGGAAGEGELARFRLEAESLARLAHPNIVAVYEIGEHDGRPFFSLELCTGGSLDKKLAGTPLPAAEAARLVEVLARAVHAAHEAGVVHRDLKPANVLLAADGAPRVTDFGLAKQLQGDSGQTRTGAIMGTPSYMAPEQAAGSKDVGPLADVWALGAILYECLTGRPPFRAASALDTVLQVVGEEPVPPRQLNAKVPPDLETIALKCLQKEPHRRYASAAALADDLRRWLSSEPIAARPAGPVERAVKWARRRPTLAALLGVCVLGAGLLTAAGVVFTLRVSAERDIARRERAAAEIERDRAGRNLYAAQMALAQVAWRGGQWRRARELLALADEPQRGFEWHYLRRLVRERKNIPGGHQSRVLAVALLDGWWASADADGVAFLRLLPPGTTAEEFELDTATPSFTFTRSGLAAGGGRDGVVHVFNPRARPLEWAEAHTGAGPVSAVALSGDGKWLATGANDGSVRLWRIDRSKGRLPGPAWQIDAHAEQVTALAFSRDGQRLASGGLDRVVRVHDVATGQPLKKHEGHLFAIRGLDWAPDGTLASASLDSTVQLWPASGAGRPRVLRGHGSAVFSLAFSPDGRRLATGGHDQAVVVWSMADLKTPQFRLADHTGPVAALGFSADGQRLISGGYDQSVRLWDLAAGKQSSVLTGAQSSEAVEMPPAWQVELKGGQAYSVAVSPDGDIACPTADRRVHLLRDGKPVKTWPTPGPPALSVAFVAPGRLAEGGAAGELTLVDVASGRRTSLGKPHAWAVMSLAVQPGGRLLASASLDTTVKLWSLPEGQLLRTLAGHREAVFAVAFAPGGRQLASASYDGSVRLWDVDTGQEVRRLMGHDGGVSGVSYSPDGRLLASAGSDATWRLWDVASGEVVQAGRGHGRELTGIAFSPDGKRLATCSWDRTVRVWSPRDGQQLLALPAHDGAVVGMAWSGDGRRIVSAGADGKVKLWDGSP